MPNPTVTAVTPNFGSLNGGTALILTGTNFTGATGVTIGGVAATDLVVISATSITIKSPAGSAGTASIVVTNVSGSNGANSLYFYTGAGVPTDTYIYLKGGRGDGFVPQWTGIFQDGVIEEQSEPYRDLFEGKSNISASAPNAGSVSYAAQTALIYDTPVLTPPAYSGGTTNPGGLSGTLTASTSDEIAHVKPRQFAKTVTCRSYASSTGLWYHFRLADILGVGSKSRDS